MSGIPPFPGTPMHHPPPPHMQGPPPQMGPGPAGPPGAGTPMSAGIKRKAEEGTEPRKQRPPLPPPFLLASLVPDSAMFADLLSMEQKLDWTMLRKKAEVQDGIGRPVKVKRTLRIFLSNTAFNQPSTSAAGAAASAQGGGDAMDTDAKDGEGAADGEKKPAAPGGVNVESGQGVPGWVMKVEGRLLDTGNARIDKLAKRKFSQLVKTLVVEMDDRPPELYGGESNIVEWHAAAHPGSATTNHLDGFEIRRRGDQAVNTRILIHLNQYPDRFKVLPPLSDLIGVREESRAGVMAAVWKWIKAIGAQDRDDPTRVLLQGGVEKIVSPQPDGSIPFHRLPEVVNQFLVHPDPVILNYTVQVNEERHVHPIVFDIPIEIEDPQKSKMHAAVMMLEGNAAQPGQPNLVKEVMSAEDEVAVLAHTIRTAKQKRDFLQAFASDPHGFIHRWLDSQARDLDTILGNEIGVPGTNGGRVREEDLRRSDMFRLPWVEEAVTIREGMRQVEMQQAAAARQEEERRRLHHQQQQQRQSMHGGMGMPGR